MLSLALLLATLAFLAPRARAADPKSASPPLTLEMVVPFFEGSKDAGQLAPLQSWIVSRIAARSARRAESEIRDALKKIRRQREDNLQHSFDLVVDLRDERARLRAELLNHTAGPHDGARRYAKFAPIPAMEDIFPTITGISLTPESGVDVPAENSIPGAPVSVESRASDTAPVEPDVHELLDRLENDINALEQLIHVAIDQDDGEELRLQRALKALPAFIKGATAATNTAPTPARSAAPAS